eukprot:3841354-Amphidinium_carterae.1
MSAVSSWLDRLSLTLLKQIVVLLLAWPMADETTFMSAFISSTVCPGSHRPAARSNPPEDLAAEG